MSQGKHQVGFTLDAQNFQVLNRLAKKHGSWKALAMKSIAALAIDKPHCVQAAHRELTHSHSKN